MINVAKLIHRAITEVKGPVVDVAKPGEEVTVVDEQRARDLVKPPTVKSGGVLASRSADIEGMCNAFQDLLGRLKNGVSAKSKDELLRDLRILSDINKNFEKIPEELKDAYRQNRAVLIDFFILKGVERGYPEGLVSGFVKKKLSDDPKKGIAGLRDLLKKGLADFSAKLP